MLQQITNYRRFFAAFNRLSHHSADREAVRRHLVLQFTDQRTDSLREMHPTEYARPCQTLENEAGDERRRNLMREELRQRRSVCLKMMQHLGIDTTDWARINAFCRDPRIAGMDFARLTADDLEHLAVKLRSIRRRGGLRRAQPAAPLPPSDKSDQSAPSATTICRPIRPRGNA